MLSPFCLAGASEVALKVYTSCDFTLLEKTRWLRLIDAPSFLACLWFDCSVIKSCYRCSRWCFVMLSDVFPLVKRRIVLVPLCDSALVTCCVLMVLSAFIL